MSAASISAVPARSAASRTSAGPAAHRTSVPEAYDEFLAARVGGDLLLHYIGHPARMPSTVPQGARFRKLR